MTVWGQLFAEPGNSGVYPANPSESRAIRSAAVKSGLAFYGVNASGARDKKGFLEAVARDLSFPGYFGCNWDAFEECLAELSWQQADGCVLLLENVQDFAFRAPAEMKTARSILLDVSEYWKEQGMRFFVIVIGKSVVGASRRTPSAD